jgi:hypothetical protein
MPYSIPDFGLQISFVKKVVIKVLNLALIFVESWQVVFGSWQ